MRETRVDHVTRVLAERIESGVYPPGHRLPSYRELQDEFGVSEIVIRFAMRALRERDLVEAQHGVGVFVKERT